MKNNLYILSQPRKEDIRTGDNDCLFSDIQNLYNAVSDWLIKKINNPIETNEPISYACCNIVSDNSGTS